MNSHARIEGVAAPIDIANLDTDQIMPKQFLRGIDKRGLDKGLLWDLRFDGSGKPRPEFVLNLPTYSQTKILIAGPNFGCGSSREHAVWGLQQYGIAAVVAPSFGEIFYSNAMNNGLLALMVTEEDATAFMNEAKGARLPITLLIDVAASTVKSPRIRASFVLSARHRRMFLEGLDMIGASLAMEREILAFAHSHWAQHPWIRDVAARTKERLDCQASPTERELGFAGELAPKLRD